jgi:hypothetical protein
MYVHESGLLQQCILNPNEEWPCLRITECEQNVMEAMYVDEFASRYTAYPSALGGGGRSKFCYGKDQTYYGTTV